MGDDRETMDQQGRETIDARNKEEKAATLPRDPRPAAEPAKPAPKPAAAEPAKPTTEPATPAQPPSDTE